MTTKNNVRVGVKFYLEKDDEVLKRFEYLQKITGLSMSSIAGMTVRYGLPAVEKILEGVMNDAVVEPVKPKRKSK